MNGSGSTCGDADSILIDSTVNLTQRTWSGNDIFTLIDATVNDMAGTATVFVYNGTNNGNNGANWVFRNECPEGDPGTLRNIRIRGGIKVKGGVKVK